MAVDGAEAEVAMAVGGVVGGKESQHIPLEHTTNEENTTFGFRPLVASTRARERASRK